MAGLTTVFGSDPSDTTKPYYPASLATSCSITGGTYSAASNNCINVCSAGSSYYAPGNVCNKACTGGGVYDSGTNTCQSCASVNGTYSGGQCTNTNTCTVGTYFSGTATCDTCPATGYATGTYSSGNCTRSCPTGYTYNGTAPGYCVPTGGTFNAGNYCPSGQTITGALCYPTRCFPDWRQLLSRPATPSRVRCAIRPAYLRLEAITVLQAKPSSGAFCYPTGASAYGHRTTAPPGSRSTAHSAIRPARSFGSGHYCPATNTISASPGTHCCPSGYTWNVSRQYLQERRLDQSGHPVERCECRDPDDRGHPRDRCDPRHRRHGRAARTNRCRQPIAHRDHHAGAERACHLGSHHRSRRRGVRGAQDLPNGQSVQLRYRQRTNQCWNRDARQSGEYQSGDFQHVLDYAPIPNAYKEITSFQIANEGAMTRGAATPIFYNLKDHSGRFAEPRL